MPNNCADDLKKIKELIEIMKENGLVEVEINHGDNKILLKRSDPQASKVNAVPYLQQGVGMPISMPAEAVENASEASDSDLFEITSPIVGTFYSAASPESEPYVQSGSSVTTQTVVCIIEAMKVMNEIKAEVSGTIVEILVNDGQAIEYGQPLFKVKPN